MREPWSQTESRFLRPAAQLRQAETGLLCPSATLQRRAGEGEARAGRGVPRERQKATAPRGQENASVTMEERWVNREMEQTDLECERKGRGVEPGRGGEGASA